MHLEHTFTLPVGIDEAWRVLHDIGSVAASVPGSTLTSATADAAEGSLKVKLGPLNATYRGSARLVSADESARTAVVEATGDTARSGSASATVTAVLAEDGEATTVTLSTELTVDGKPAQFGQSVMSDVGTRLVGGFAASFGELLTSGSWVASGAGPAPKTTTPRKTAARKSAAPPESTPRKAAPPKTTPPSTPAVETGTTEAPVAGDRPAPDAPSPSAEPVTPEPSAAASPAGDEPTFVAPTELPAPTAAEDTIPSVNGHGSPDPAGQPLPAGATNRDLNALLRPFLIRGVAPVTIAVVVVLGRFRRRRRRR